MATVDIFNLDETIQNYLNEINTKDLNVIVEEFKLGHFLNVLSKLKAFQEMHDINKGLARTFSLLKATCHSQLGEEKQAADIIKNIYQNTSETTIDDLILYGNLAYMCDYKLARQIMSGAVNQIENESEFDQMKAARAYLILGQAEEKLHKLSRSIKYYKRALHYLKEEEELILFIHYKLGELLSLKRETDEAIDYLQKTIELAKEENVEVKINCFVSIGKLYGIKNEYEKANSFLNKAFPLFKGSLLDGKLVHAEAFSEMAFNYFDQGQYDKANPYYEKAIALYQILPNQSPRELGMIHMQYAYCMEKKEQPEKLLAATNYEKAMEQLEKTKDKELIENALGDIMAFFERTGNKKKKRYYENKFVKMMSEKAN